MGTQDESREILQFHEVKDVAARDAAFDEREREALEAINRRVAAGDSLAAMIDLVFDTTREIFPCDRIGLAFVEEDGRVVAHLSRAHYEPMLLGKGYAEDLRGSSLAAVIQTGRVRIINDLERYLEMKPASASTRLLVKEGVRSSMTCPLAVDGRNVGLLFRSSRRPFAYGMREVLLHLAVAERLSQAVEKAYRIEQLAAANAAYFEMLGFVSHELKSPVSSIVMDAKVLTDGYLGDMSERQRAKIEQMIVKAEYLLGLVREYLDLARIEGGELSPRFRADVDFAEEVTGPSVGIVAAQFEEKQADFEQAIEGEVGPVECDPELMKVVLVNLLGNAAKYGNVMGKVRLRTAYRANRLVVSVWNEGPGFPESEKPKLFRKFSRLQTKELLKRKGTGVGLYTTWRIIQAHHGVIRAESEPGAWAEFTLELPRPLEGPASTGDEGA